MDTIWALLILATIAFFVTGLFINSSLRNTNRHVYETISLIEILSRKNEKMRKTIEQIKEKQDGQ
jgi:hypothetical protein